MIGNALIVTIAILLALVFWLMGELKFFATYKLVLWREYATPILTYVALLSVNVFAAAFVSSANSSSRTPGENSLISTNSFTPARPRCPRQWLEEESD